MDKKEWCKNNVNKLTKNGKQCLIGYLRMIADDNLGENSVGCFIDLDTLQLTEINNIATIIQSQIDKELTKP